MSASKLQKKGISSSFELPILASVPPPQAHRVSQRSGRNAKLQGYLIDYGEFPGNLLAEQANQRLKNSNNRFPLAAQNTIVKDNTVLTRWSVDDRYEFQSFEKGDIYTEIGLSSSQVLKLPDGLSHYLTVLNMASAFDHWSEWMETWNV